LQQQGGRDDGLPGEKMKQSYAAHHRVIILNILEILLHKRTETLY
jgi:hypothetical protein